MAYRFQSRSTGDVVMLEHNGKQLLQILGRDPAQPGILLVEQLPGAIDTVLAAIAQEEADFERKKQEAREQGGYEPDPERISLRTRFTPFLDMLRHSLQEGTEVLWGLK